MDIQIIEQNLDYISINYQFSYKGSDTLKKYIKDEIVSQVIADTTLIHNVWSAIPNKKNMFRSTGGLTLIVSTNKFIIQVSGEAFLFLDEADIKDILIRARKAIDKNRRLDFEKEIKAEMIESVGRLDSQITISIDKKHAEDFFSLNDLSKSGRERIFKKRIGENLHFTGKSWIRNKEIDIYLKNTEELKKEPQPILQKRDFLRIYDKLTEVIETTIPHSDKRHQLIEKYKKFILPDRRIFRLEIQENDRMLTKHLIQILDYNPNSFQIVCFDRLKVFKKRNPFIFLDVLCPDASMAAGDEQDDQVNTDLGLG